MYRGNPGRRPSAYLISKLRRHEALQRRCGPGTAAYSNALEQLKSGKRNASPECAYIVSISYSGLGNRILAAASAFLYAVLTHRVLLVDPSNEMDDLFCEPFPDTTWLLPRGFPMTNYTSFGVDTAESYGNMVRNKVIGSGGVAADASTARPPAFAYVHLHNDATVEDNYFFCDDDQRLLRRIQWLAMRTDSYIVPGLFLVQAFQDELDLMFPERDAVFHHIGRYLFHPNNHVWGLVTRYYDAYLAAAQQRVGIQVRVFGVQPNSPELLEQITSCTQKQKLLPEVLATGAPTTSPASRARSKAVLVTSLKSWYYEKLKSMYWEHAAVTGEAVSVHQPSHEEYQRSGARSHEHKAWAEIYLLSLTDVLVTTGMSTFGYVAQGLGGVRPWVLYKSTNSSAVPDPPCGWDVSIEPCFHKPPSYDCRLKQWAADISKDVPYIQHCDDLSWGLKLVGRNK
ncbi:galactoside 2-alpha-L-fucosyltransferase-like [Miscanthus floridulus]|uniref:galactoside 2-alpha-L-fucosyltransferase-like n=1 Tax=Miscanthus floridulus TaxID=154761 RepID=UPI00345B4236